MQELTTSEKDLVLLGIMSCTQNSSDTTLSTKQKQVLRKKNRFRHFYYEHKCVCLDSFLYFMDISKKKLN